MNQLSKDILQHCVAYITDLTTDSNDFYPFGAFVYPGEGNNIHPLEFDFDAEKNNAIKEGEIIAYLENFCSSDFEAETIKAYAIVCDTEVTLPDNGKKKCFQITITNREEKEELPFFYVPYTIKKGVWSLETIFAVKK